MRAALESALVKGLCACMAQSCLIKAEQGRLLCRRLCMQVSASVFPSVTVVMWSRKFQPQQSREMLFTLF